jgi:hypothetical protein
MRELDDRLTRGLLDLLDRAPSDADVWATTERYVQRGRRRRQMLVVVVVAAVLAVFSGVALRSAGGNQQVRVATTVPHMTAGTTSVSTPTTRSATAIPSTTVSVPRVEACPAQCIGQSAADIDGDARDDRVGLFATPPLSGNLGEASPSKLTIRVVFADGRVAEYEDTADWDASLVGAAAVDGSDKAKIFYFNFTGANNRMGHVLQWDGTRLIAVRGDNGEPFTTLIAGYAMGGRGFRCAGSLFMATQIQQGPEDHQWRASQTIYEWTSDALVEVAADQPVEVTQPPRPAGLNVPPEYEQLIGVHCAGLEQ